MGDSLFAQTTVQAFQDAGAAVKSMKDIFFIEKVKRRMIVEDIAAVLALAG